jgi:hypothetical protein
VGFDCHMSPYIGVKNEHISNGQWTFHGVSPVIIIVTKILMIEIIPMNF